MRKADQKSTRVTKLDLEEIKKKLQKLYADEAIVHISSRNGRVKMDNVCCTITGVYTHFMCVTAHIKNYHEESFTINFIDIIIGKVSIFELENQVELETIE